MTEGEAIFIENLHKSYGGVKALRGIDLSVRKGEIFGFLGPNGAGKTTTIRCLLDLIRPDRGTLRVLGLNPQKEPVAVRARAGYLPGELHLDDNMTGEEALRFFNRLRGRTAQGTHLLSLAERLDADLTRPIRNLSQGNKQKIGLLQALMHQPELLVLDEPTGGLDPLIQHELLQILREARQNGATIFFSSHAINVVEAIADRVGIIRQGRIIEVARTSDLQSRSIRRARIRFRRPVDPQVFARLPGVRVLSEDQRKTILVQIQGDMEVIIRALAELPVIEIETLRPSLEEIFLTYYAGSEEG